MAKVYSSGPCLIWAGVGPGKSPVFFGTAETEPYIDISPAFLPVFNDLGGKVKPFDKSSQGEDGSVLSEMNRFNEGVYQLMATRPNPRAIGVPLGTTLLTDIGAIMNQEGLGFPLWVSFPNNAKAAYSDMPAGYHFFSAWLEGPDHTRPGTRDLNRRCLWYCSRVFDITPPATFDLYDFDMSAIAGLRID